MARLNRSRIDAIWQYSLCQMAKIRRWLPKRPRPLLRRYGSLRREVPPWKRRHHDGEEAPGGNWQSERQSNRGCGGPRERKCEGDVRRHAGFVKAAIPLARRLRSLRDLDEGLDDDNWKAQRYDKPADSTVPGVSEIQARNNR